MRTGRDARRRGVELLDGHGIDPRVIREAMSDVMRANRLFGAGAAIAAELRAVAPSLPRPATLLDVGTGMGDMAERAQRIAAEHGVSLRTIGLDIDETLVCAAADRTSHVVRGNAGQLPFADKSIDVVICSQVLHHFFDEDLPRVLRELDRVARVRVIIGDLLRSRVAGTLFWAAATALGFHPVTRHDGLVSIGRGFTTSDLQASIVAALGHGACVRTRPGWRVTATWTPVAAHPAWLASAA
jgi:SAM-dependent methyltransferase